MPRNLPWSRHETIKRESGAQSSPAPAPSTPRAKTADRTPERVVRALKSPSTSPPPQPLTETFMLEGVEGDDKYRMVEDELLSIAGRFTAQLHAAEYHRQKQDAKARNADTIDTISRPVVGRMTPGVKAKHERQAKERKRRDGLKKALAKGKEGGLDVDEAEDESPWMGTSLQGLMEEPQGSVARLSGLTSVEPSTKAAARLGLAARKGQSRLLAGSLVTSRPSQRQPTWPLKSGPKPDTKAPTPRNGRGAPTTVPISSDSDDDDLLASLRRRRQESKAPVQKRQKPTEGPDDVIPSFL